MTFAPIAKVSVDRALSDDQRLDVQHKIEAVKGVLSTSFNEKSGSFTVTYYGAATAQEIRKIEGVTSFDPYDAREDARQAPPHRGPYGDPPKYGR